MVVLDLRGNGLNDDDVEGEGRGVLHLTALKKVFIKVIVGCLMMVFGIPV